MLRVLLSLLTFTLLISPVQADVQLAPIFGDDMVLQRDMLVPVWGTASPGEEVTVSFLEQKKSTTANKDGKWLVKLDKLTAGGPHKLVIEGKNKVQLTGVLVGEVWVCSGQSNMVWRLRQSENAENESKNANLPKVRFNAGSKWQTCTPTTAMEFSACGYYFGRDLAKKLDVPIGLINRSVGGTSARRWTAQTAMEAEPALKPFMASILKPVEAKPKDKDKNKNKDKPKAPQKPGDLYAANIQPLVGFAIRGVIWYQGESDAGRADEYAVLFPTLIRSWRSAWGQGDFPFLFVQLAPIGGARTWPMLREVQFLTLTLVPNTAMAVIIDSDVGIHPVKKELPGSRLALAARALAYGEKLVYSGPVYKAMKIENEKAELSFNHVGGGLQFKGEKAVGWEVLDATGKSHPAEARIDGEKVVVWSKDVARPTAVRYGWSNDPRCNLYNREGLPASPFRTDVPMKK